MARKTSRTPSETRERKDKKTGRPQRKKICAFCKDKVAYIDFKDVSLIRRFVSDRGKIRARRVTGTCVQHQHEVAAAIKNAREVALIPYVMR